MHYLDQFIREQSEKNALAGYKETVNLEYVENQFEPPFKYQSYKEVDPQLLDIVMMIRDARNLFNELSDDIKEAKNPSHKEKIWNAVIKAAL
jgi:hypothetical protein